MKTRITVYLGVYWPLVAALTLAVLAALKSYGGDERHAPLPAAQVSNELARAVSYGLVGGRAEAGVVGATRAGGRASARLVSKVEDAVL